jgi:tetratricopeptide (TPR) repeat protein
MALFHLGRYDKALAAYGRAIELAPEEARNFRAVGTALLFLGRAEDAVAAFRRASELVPDDEFSWFGKGKALQSLGRHREAPARVALGALLCARCCPGPRLCPRAKPRSTVKKTVPQFNRRTGFLMSLTGYDSSLPRDLVLSHIPRRDQT